MRRGEERRGGGNKVTFFPPRDNEYDKVPKHRGLGSSYKLFFYFFFGCINVAFSSMWCGTPVGGTVDEACPHSSLALGSFISPCFSRFFFLLHWNLPRAGVTLTTR